MPKGAGQATQLCWSCANAVPSEETGRGCEWSARLEPVPGWTATRSEKGYGGTWKITKCPKFVQEARRPGWIE